MPAMNRRQFLSLASGVLGTAAWPARAALPMPMPLRRLRLYNPHTGERFDGPYRDDLGPIPLAMEELSEFLRDFHSGERIAIDVRLLDFVAAVMDAVGAPEAAVLSAYRTHATNAMLARTTFGVADNSQHLYGRALDLHLGPRLEDAMLAARAMRQGGVGWYPRSHFIHLDSGPVRHWTLDLPRLDDLLLHLQRLLARGGLTVSRQGQLLLGPARRPPTPAQRLALHRAIAAAAAHAGP